MKKQSCDCGSVEFATCPNSYDIYTLVDGEYHYQRREFTREEETLFCRDCGKEAG